ncbi:MAG: FAD-binding oxidoreductase [Gaiellales bacterium]
MSEAAALLRECGATGRTVSIERAGGDVVLSTDRLSRLIEHEAGDLTCVVEAGIRLSELQARLAPHRQVLALDPPGDPTVGACIAGALSGPLRHRYGAARDLVLGITAVLADGTIASSGGKVVKNVAGYDLAKLFCGSRGTLGLVARVALRLHPLPESSQAVVVPTSEPAPAAELVQTLLRSELSPSAADLLWPGSLALLFQGSPRAVAAQVDRAASELRAGEASLTIFDEARARQGDAQGRVAFAPGDLEQHLATYAEAIVRVGAGVAYLPGPSGVRPNAGVEMLSERIRARFDPAGVLAA